MRSNFLSHVISTTLIVLPLVVMLAACKKKEEAAVIPPSAPETAPVAQAAPEQTPAAAPVDITPLVTAPADNGQALSAAENLRKTKDYERAAATLLQIQQRQLSDQQAAAARAAMVQLQQDLVNGVSAGDAKAKRAADLLRAAHSVR